MSVADFVSRFSRNRQQFSEMEKDEKMVNLLAQKKKTSNERELERFLEEERQKQIKLSLEHFRAKRREENRSMSVLKDKNVFKGHKNLLSEDKNVLDNGSNSFMKSGNMFSKGNMLGRSGVIK